MDLVLRLEFSSDWHVGSGTSTPEIDALVIRDPSGYPQVPAKTITGLWRQQFETVAAAMSQQNPLWSKVPDLVFGTQPNLASGPSAAPPVGARLAVTPMRYDAAVRHAIADATGVPAPPDLTVIRPGVRIDPTTGTAEDKYLRSIEHGRAGTVLHGAASLDLDGLDGSSAEAVLAALVAAASLLERAGGNRRRGAGRCNFRVTLPSSEHARDAAWAAEVLSRTGPPADPEVPDATETPPGSSGDGSAITVAVRLLLHTPVGITSQVSGNLHETHDHIPGSVMLAWVADRLRRAGAGGLRDAIVSGRIWATPATVEIAGQRSLPTPAAYGQAKGTSDGPASAVNRSIERLEGDVQVKDLRGGWVVLVDDNVHRRTTPITVQAHNTIDDARQRPTADVGGLYLYEAISPVWPDGRRLALRAEVTVPIGELGVTAAAVRTALCGEARLGRSSKDDYGLVTVEIPASDASDEPAATSHEMTQSDDRLVVWCTSDLIIDPSSPGTLPTIDDVRLAIAAGLHLDPAQVDVVAPSDGLAPPSAPEGSWLRHRRIESFHTRWQLPRPTLLAVAAGSVIVLRVVDPPADLAGRLRSLEREALGRRRAEGFGQICFDHRLTRIALTHTGLTPADHGHDDTELLGHELEPEEQLHVRSVADARWQREITQRSQRLALDRSKRKTLLGGYETGTSPSQRGTLRSLVAGFGGVLHSSDAQRATGHAAAIAAHLAKEDQRNDNPDRSRDQIKTGALRSLMTEPNTVWHWLGFDDSHAGPNLEARERLWSYAVRVSVESALRAKEASDS
jgi:CRISPR-associated protein Csx10